MLRGPAKPDLSSPIRLRPEALMRPRSWSALLALAAIAVFGATLAPACRDNGGDDSVTPGDDGGVDAPINSDDMKIQMVQDDNTPVGTPVTLRGVVVTAIDKYG